jgi:hypothetical protein
MDRKVGYASPPKHSQFAKGQSGNPSGRPKRPRAFGDDLMAELAEVIEITEGGRRKRITKQRALIKALTAGGIKGNARAASLLMGWCARVIEAEGGNDSAEGLSAEDRKIVEDYLERQVQLRLAAKGESDVA